MREKSTKFVQRHRRDFRHVKPAYVSHSHLKATDLIKLKAKAHLLLQNHSLSR